MDLYDDLASNNEEIRIKAAESLVNKILLAERSGNPEKGTDLPYALNRLVKGLSSGRESARLGFSVALTELLHELSAVDVAEVLQLLEKHTTPSGNISGVEERDFYFGRLFGLNVLLESEILYRPSTSSDTITTVINGFFDLASKKTWLREPTAKAICTLIISLPRFQSPKFVSESVQQKLNESGLLQYPDGAAILLVLHTLPKELRPNTNKVWHRADPLHTSNLSLLTKVLKESSTEDDTVKHTGTFKGEAHFIWMFILRRYMEQATEMIPFEKLWKSVVENGFFSSSSSLERKYRGFQLFNLFLPQLPTELIKCLFTDNFMRSLVNHSCSGDRYLNKAAKKTLSMIRAACETRPEITATVYESLVAYSPKFDRLTKSKTIEDLYSLLSTTQIPSIISFLTTKILSKTAAEGEKKWYIDQILVILRQPSRQQDAVEQGLEFLCREGFFVSSTLTKSDKTVLRERLFSLLANLISDKDEVWATRAVMMVEKMEDEGAKKVIKLDSEIKKIRKAGLKTMKKLRSQRIKTQSQSQRGLEMLYALTLLQLYAGDPEAVAVIQDLQEFYEMTLTREEGHIEILVEIVLGFLSKNSVLQRRLGEQVFGSFVGELTSKALGMLLDVLLTPETVAGAGSLFENADDEMESSEEVEDEDDDQGEDEEGDIDEGEEEDEEENEEEDMEMDIDNDADEELDAALSAALGTSKAAINGTSDAGSTSDEDLMDDDEMMALGENLATIFRQRLHQKPTQKKENQEKKEQIVIFKSKVIDLLDILIKHPSPLHLDLILPLLQVLRVTKNDAVHSKTIILLNKLAKNKFLPEATEGLMGLLRKVHEDAAKSRGKDGNIHSQLSIYIARVARKAGIEEEVVGVYAETMRSWIKNGKNNVRAGLFTDWVNWCQSIRR